jgi:hypothetical protein
MELAETSQIAVFFAWKKRALGQKTACPLGRRVFLLKKPADRAEKPAFELVSGFSSRSATFSS